MSTSSKSNHSRCDVSAVEERAPAPFQHARLFDKIEDNPQIGIYKRHGKEWALYTSYIEGQVRDSANAVETILSNYKPSGGGKDQNAGPQYHYDEAMSQLGKDLFEHWHAVDASSKMASHHGPSKRSMDEYRVNSGCDDPSARAANGEPNSVYGREGESVPSNLLAIVHEDFDTMAQLVAWWFLDSLLDFAVLSFKKVRHWMFSRRKSDHVEADNEQDEVEVDNKRVDVRVVSTVAGALVSMVAIASLVAPIATLNSVKTEKSRFILMTVFGYVFVSLAQFMGPRSNPLFTLITGYFQTMVIFVAITNNQAFGN